MGLLGKNYVITEVDVFWLKDRRQLLDEVKYKLDDVLQPRVHNI